MQHDTSQEIGALKADIKNLEKANDRRRDYVNNNTNAIKEMTVVMDRLTSTMPQLHESIKELKVSFDSSLNKITDKMGLMDKRITDMEAQMKFTRTRAAKGLFLIFKDKWIWIFAIVCLIVFNQTSQPFIADVIKELMK